MKWRQERKLSDVGLIPQLEEARAESNPAGKVTGLSVAAHSLLLPPVQVHVFGDTHTLSWL